MVGTRSISRPDAAPSLPSGDGGVPRAVLEFPVGEHGEAPPRSTLRDPLSRWVLALAGAFALLVSFSQAPGRIVSDTKLPLVMSPKAFMSTALHLWDPNMWSGSIQTLSFGYIFPLGAFYQLGHLLHVPVWCTERLWLALLLTTGFWGVVRLAEALHIGNRRGRVLGAIAYVIAPIVVTWAAVTAALLAVVLLPWVLIPLVRGSDGGSPRRAAFASGIAVALMGGVNSTVVLASLPLGALWLLTRPPGPRRRALIGWWAVALVLACFWWVAGLVVETHYGYNYLPYTETARMTTSTASLFESFRGASYWLDYFTLRGPLVPGAWSLVSSVPGIVGTTVVAGLGLAGLTRRIPERLFLVGALTIGVVVIAAGYAGTLGGPEASAVQNLLGGPLAALRNVSKFSPDVALPLALGVVSITSEGLDLRRRRRVPSSRGLRPVKTAVALVAVGAVVLAAAPFWQSQLYPPGTFTAIPGYWSQAANWLDTHQDHGTALLTPAASFGEYTWGRPLDEPLSVLASSSWSVRSLVPFGSNGNDQVMDALEASLDQGEPEARMGQYLARAGYDYVVVRNDLDLARTGAPPPAQVRQVLSATPGLKLVASFGPVISRYQSNPSRLAVYDPTDAHGLRSVQIYRVLSNSAVVRTYPASDPVIVSGSPSSLLPLLSAGTLEGRAAFLAGDVGSRTAAAAPSATWADTDGNQRRDVSFGTVRDNASYVLGSDQRSAIAQSGVPQNLAVVAGPAHQTVAQPLGAASVSASSFSSTPLALDSSQDPAAAFDDNRATAWVAYATDHSVGQWAQINFGRSVPLRTITVRPLADGAQRPTVQAIRISTAQGSVVRHIHPGSNTVTVPRGSSAWLRVTLTVVQPARARPLGGYPLGAGLTSVAIPGVHYVPALRVPDDEATAFVGRGHQVALSFSAPVTDPNFELGQATDDDPLMVRRFDAPAATTLTMLGQVTPSPGPALSSLLAQQTGQVQVTSSSVLAHLPRYSANNLVTDSNSPWIAAQGDSRPSLTFRWSGQRSVSSITIAPTSQGARPLLVRISNPTGSFLEPVPARGGTVTFPAITTDTLTIRFVKVARTTALVPATGTRIVLPVGVGRLSIGGVGSGAGTTPSSQQPLDLSCGKGPDVRLDGTVFRTKVVGSVSDLENVSQMGFFVCGTVAVGQGSHVIEAGRLGGAFKVTSIQGIPSAQPTATGRSVRIVGPWTTDHRTVHVGAGGAAYLAVAQNYNAGWRATLAGRQLTPVRLDGWEQGWQIPAGRGGTVVMTMPADNVYRLALLAGAALLVLLAVGALVRRGRRDQPRTGAGRHVPTVVLGALSLGALALVCGPLALILLPLWFVGRRWGRVPLACIAAGALIAAGVAAAVGAGAPPLPTLGAFGWPNQGAFGWPAQAGAAIAFAAVLASLIARTREHTAETPATGRRRWGAGAV